MKYKYLVLLIFITALFIPNDYALYFFPAAILFLLLLDLHLFRFVLRISFLLLIFLLIILQPLIIGDKNFIILGIKISSEGFYNGIIMVLRAVVMIPSVTYLLKISDKTRLKDLFVKFGIHNFDEILDHSQKLFPLLRMQSKEFFKKKEHNKYYNPIEFTAQFTAFLIRATYTYQNKSKGENVI